MTISLTKRVPKGSPLTAAEHDANLTAIENEVNPPIVTAEITDDAVTNAKLANMAAGTYKMRVTASTGDPEDATATQATAGLNVVTSALKGLAPASGGGTANFLRADATWAAPAGGGAATSSINGHIETVAIKAYVLELKAPTSYTINSLTTDCASGSCTVALQIDGVNVTGLSAVSVTTTEVETNATAANTVAVGATLALVVTANTACLDFWFTVKVT